MEENFYLKHIYVLPFTLEMPETSGLIFLVWGGEQTNTTLSCDKCSTEGFLNCIERTVYNKTYLVSLILTKNPKHSEICISYLNEISHLQFCCHTTVTTDFQVETKSFRID